MWRPSLWTIEGYHGEKAHCKQWCCRSLFFPKFHLVSLLSYTSCEARTHKPERIHVLGCSGGRVRPGWGALHADTNAKWKRDGCLFWWRWPIPGQSMPLNVNRGHQTGIRVGASVGPPRMACQGRTPLLPTVPLCDSCSLVHSPYQGD